MRKRQSTYTNNYNIVVLDDEIGIVDSVKVITAHLGYSCKGFTEPIEAIEYLKTGKCDLLILDYLMKSMNGDTVVEKIREFNSDLYILLLTGHKDLAPPMETLKELDIQGYCEKSDNFNQLILLIESGLKSVQMVKRIKNFENGLNKILNTVPKIYQLQPIGQVLEEILIGILPLINSENAFILNDKNYLENDHITIFKGIGRFDKGIDEVMVELSTEIFYNLGVAREDKKVVITENGIIFPLINEYKECLGVLYVESTYINDGKQLIEIYSKQAASSLSNAFLHSLVNVKNEELNNTYNELKKYYMETIEVLRLAVDAKDEYTRGHSDRVSYYAVKLGDAFNLNSEELELLRLGGIFHDVGKIGTSDDILFKTETLNSLEYDEVKKHTLKGAYILSALSMFKEVVPIIKSHHERYDGKGYPEGLTNDQIPFLARILSVVDAFDAMTSDRLYRSKLDLKEAQNQLLKGAGSQFDNEVVDKFIEILKNFDEMQKELSHTFINGE